MLTRPGWLSQLLGLLRWPSRPASTAPQPAGPKAPELMTHEDWVRHRAPVRHRDESLSNAALAWLRALPDEVQPQELCARFPRIANRLALLWRDSGLIEHCLDELLAPTRPGRQGFPAEIAAELLALKRLNDARIYEPDPADPTPAG